MWSEPIDGFRLAYDRVGSGDPVFLLHGWPGDRADYSDVVPLLAASCELVVPDLRGFGGSDKHPADSREQYNAAAQARSVVGLIRELNLGRVVLAGYDIGSRIAQHVATEHPELVTALVIAPPLPGIGRRILEPAAQQEYWYQAFHQLDLAEKLVDGNPTAVRTYLRHFWSHWSGPSFELDENHLDHLVSVYSAPGAFVASIRWYRAGAGAVAASAQEKLPGRAGRIAVPTTVLWGRKDALFPTAWSDRLDEFFGSASLQLLDDIGHFVPKEDPETFAAAIRSSVVGTG